LQPPKKPHTYIIPMGATTPKGKSPEMYSVGKLCILPELAATSYFAKRANRSYEDHHPQP
jgi:hypothetical protein